MTTIETGLCDASSILSNKVKFDLVKRISIELRLSSTIAISRNCMVELRRCPHGHIGLACMNTPKWLVTALSRIAFYFHQAGVTWHFQIDSPTEYKIKSSTARSKQICHCVLDSPPTHPLLQGSSEFSTEE